MIKFADFKAPVIAEVEMGIDENKKPIIHQFSDNTLLALEYDKLSQDRIALATENVEKIIEDLTGLANNEEATNKYLSDLTLQDKNALLAYKSEMDTREINFILEIMNFEEYGLENTEDNARLMATSPFDDGLTLLEKIADYYLAKNKRAQEKQSNVGKPQKRR